MLTKDDSCNVGAGLAPPWRLAHGLAACSALAVSLVSSYIFIIME